MGIGMDCSPRTSRSASLRHIGLILLVGQLRWHITIVSNCSTSADARAYTSLRRLPASQYNILCTVKRFEAYETIGALFREATTGTLELSASDRIWELILDTILEIAEMISADASELLSAVIDANPKFHKLYQMYKLVA